MSSRKRKGRYAKELKQEDKSKAQLEERFVDIGWTCYPSDRDLGEDYLLSVYIDGKATGAAFYLQLKSITNSDKRIQNDTLKYDFSTKDLLHWSEFALPVVLVVWDVSKRMGWWVFVDSAIKN